MLQHFFEGPINASVAGLAGAAAMLKPSELA